MLLGQYISMITLDKPIDKQSYLSKLPAIKYLSDNKSLSLSKNVTFFVGENGTGKSTLIESIAVAYGFNPEGGTKNFNFSTNQSHSDLWEHITLSKGKFAKDGFFLRAESFYNVASNIDEMDKQPAFSPPVINSYGGVSLHNQSHGESFLALVQNRFRGNGIYILDEPEAALSPMRLLTLIVEIDHLVKNNSQFIIATHSPILMAFPNAEILEFSQNGIKSIDYKDTEHYKVTRSFLENPNKMLNYLLND
ncbi:MAG: AAA family ATPase [Oscillospiraceae bacterium]|nr:AAA family ATPase [Oscillospiraceae bacterium]MDD4413357.1 AAA family ATPase [Oscillospiraceae bacterium]